MGGGWRVRDIAQAGLMGGAVPPVARPAVHAPIWGGAMPAPNTTINLYTQPRSPCGWCSKPLTPHHAGMRGSA